MKPNAADAERLENGNIRRMGLYSTSKNRSHLLLDQILIPLY